MSAAANSNRTKTTTTQSIPATAINGTSPLPPNDDASKPPLSYMTMNGNNPSPVGDGGGRSLSSSSSATNNVNVNVVPAPHSTSMTTTAVKQRHHHHHHRFFSLSKNNDFEPKGPHAHAVGLSGGSPADNDATYCTEIARRSAARAALHLGTEGMEGEALDVLGSVLLGYMDQVGTTISANVETSGRSSAHANAYDALNAVELCTAPAATQLLGSNPSTASRLPLPDQSRIKEGRDMGWEGLASFLFGPDWCSIPLEGDEEAKKSSGKEAGTTSLLGTGKDGIKILQTNGAKKPGGKTILPSRPPESAVNATKPKSGKGKQLPNLKGAAENMKSVSFSLERQKSIGNGNVTDPADPGASNGALNGEGSSGRWHAPYLHSVPSFPLVTTTEDQDMVSKTNPRHRLQQGSLSLHDLATEMEACREDPPATKRPRRGSAANNGDQDGKLSAAKAKAARLKEQAADKAMRVALRIPDDVYSTVGTIWGSIKNDEKDSSSSNDTKEAGADDDKKPAAKKAAVGDLGKKATASKDVKFDESTKRPPNTGLSSEHAASSSARKMPQYVPNFLPPFPTDEYSDMISDRLAASVSTSAVMGDVKSRMAHNRDKRKHSSLEPEGGKAAAVLERNAVRRSVIVLGKPVGPSYWGSKWLENEEDGKHNPKSNITDLSGVSVAPGGSSSKSESAKNKSGLEPTQVLPLGRASGSRHAKILEGSMNVS